MKSSDYKAIQDVQLRYDNYLQCRRFDLIFDELLSKDNDISFSHQDLPSEISGRKAVEKFFDKLAAKIEKNGGYLRTDLISSQYIEFGPADDQADGTWLTIGFVCDKEKSENTEPPYDFYRVFGQRHTDFIKEDGQWKIKRIVWKEVGRTGPMPYDPQKSTGWCEIKDRRWELPPSEKTGPWKGGRSR